MGDDGVSISANDALAAMIRGGIIRLIKNQATGGNSKLENNYDNMLVGQMEFIDFRGLDYGYNEKSDDSRFGLHLKVERKQQVQGMDAEDRKETWNGLK